MARIEKRGIYIPCNRKVSNSLILNVYTRTTKRSR